MAELLQVDVEGIGDARAALLGGARGAVPDEVDGQPLAADQAEPPDGQAEARSRWPTSASHEAGSTVTTTRPGLSPKRSTDGVDPMATCEPAPSPDQMAHSASATARPPPETSWAEASRSPRAATQEPLLERRLARQVEGRRPVVGRGAGQCRVGRARQPGRRLADEDDQVALLSERG